MSIHPGALAGPGADQVPMLSSKYLISGWWFLFLRKMWELRCAELPCPFTYQRTGRTYSGTVARIAHALDQKTSTMAVEFDVFNRDGTPSPGMYPKVNWPVRRSRPALFVPKTRVVTTTERTFVIRDRNGRAQWVDVKKGASDGDLVEVIGDLQAGDGVVRRGMDELREGSPINTVTK